MTKRRIAAGLVALSLIMQVTPAITTPVDPVGPAVAAAQEASAPIDADGIASGAITNMDQLADPALIEKKRGENHGGLVGGRLYAPTTGDFSTVGQGNERLTGYTVYSQWMDEDGAVSPVYKAETHDIPGNAGGAGSYVFHYPNWTDANGKEHVFNAKPYDVRIRMWIAPGQTGPGGGELFTIRQAPGVQPGFMNNADGGAGMWSNIPQSFTFTGIFTYEGPSDVMYAKEGDPRFHVDTKGVASGWDESDRGSVTGKVWWETGETGNLNFPNSTGENFAKKGDARVITSILTDDGVAAFTEVNSLPPSERLKKQQELLKAHPEYIAETVAAETDENGTYFARFNKKDFDNKYLYQFVQVKRDGKWVTQPAYASYQAPMYGDPTKLMNIPQLWQDARHNWTAMHFALVHQPTENMLQIDPEIGKEGDRLIPKIATYANPGEDGYVQWYNSKGEPIKLDGSKGEEKIPVSGGHNLANPLEEATLTVPEVTEDDTYNARLIYNGAIVDADSVAVAPKTKVEGAPKEVEPTDTAQDTGLKVVHLDKDTKVTAEDEDGNAIPVAVDSDGRVSVTPGTNVDGPITLTVVDPDLRYGKATYEVPVKGHAKGKDDNGQAPKTSVESAPKTVNPTDESQDSGITVKNKDDDTKVTAKDEDGKDVPVTVGDDGKISLKPGTDVDGPITVTVTDPDLKGGKAEVKVPVKGHKEGVDDNKKPEAPKTSVESAPKTVNPTDESQDSGITVKNKDDDTKVTAKDEDGKDVPVTVGDDGKISLKPGTDVDGPITVTIEDKDLPTGKAEVEVPVKGHQKGRDDSKPAFKDGTTVKPGTENNKVPTKDGKKVPAGTTAKVIDGPGTATIDKNGNLVVTPNKDAEPGATIKVEVNYPDGTKDTVTITVGQKDGQEDQNPGFKTDVQPGPGEAKVIPTEDGSKVPAGTTAEVIKGKGKATIKDGELVVTPSKDAKPGDKIDVQITYPDGTTKVITITVGIDMGLCVGASAASAIPLLLLTPIALGLAMDNQQVKDLTAGFGKQLEDINTGIQKTLGIYNPALAEQFKVQVAPHLQNLALAAGFIAYIGLLAGVAATTCTPEGQAEGSSNLSSDKTTGSKAEVTTPAEAPATDEPSGSSNN